MLACAIDRHQLAADIKARGRALGFDLVGIAPAHAIETADSFRAWLDAGKHGTMRYLARRFAERTNPDVYLAGAKTVICLAINYNNDRGNAQGGTPTKQNDQDNDAPASSVAGFSPLVSNPGQTSGLKPAAQEQRIGALFRAAENDRDAGASTSSAADFSPLVPLSSKTSELTSAAERPKIGQVARYARGDDYHQLLKDRLYELADWIRETVPGAQTKCGVDTAPIMEKPLAARAGVGWQAKNSLLIHPRIGSWLLLGEILTTLDLPTDSPMTDHCGTCTRCIDACPTRAITPYQVDATKCIAYWNIEHIGEIPESIQASMGDRLFGCDICQEVCPFNRQAPLTNEPAFESRFDEPGLRIDEVLEWTLPDYSAALHDSPIKRVKLPILQRNAAYLRRVDH